MIDQSPRRPLRQQFLNEVGVIIRPMCDNSAFDRFLDQLAADVYPEQAIRCSLDITRSTIDQLHRDGALRQRSGGLFAAAQSVVWRSNAS